MKIVFKLQFTIILIFVMLLSITRLCHGYSIALLKDDANGKTQMIAEKMMPVLTGNAFTADYISYEMICCKGSLDKYDCLVLTDSTRFPVAGRINLLDYLRKGRDVVLMGGMPFKEDLWRSGETWSDKKSDSETESLEDEKNVKPLDLPVFDNRSVYAFQNEPCIVTYQKQDILKTPITLSGSFTGVSAIGFEYPEVSRYIPLLSVQDEYSRNVGFAGGLLVNYDGEFKNSQWLFFGIDIESFYCSREFLDIMVDLLGKMKQRTLASSFAEEDRVYEAKCLAVASPAPTGFIKLSKDRKHFLLPNGKKFFALGCNYVGPFERKCEYGEDYFNVNRLEEDFRKAQEAGINAFRFWNFRIENNSDRLKTIVELARKYQIYLIITPRSHPLPTDQGLIDIFQRNAKLLNDETIVLGYDLMNEPYVTTVGSISMNGNPSDILKHSVYSRYSSDYFDKEWVDTIARHRGWPELGDWIQGQDALNLYAAYAMAKQYIEKYNPPQDYSCLYGLDGKLPIEAGYEEFMSALDDTFRDWILFHKKAINQFDSNHFITVGYNTSLAGLPSNSLLDFVSHHIYQMPYSYKDMQKSVTTFDRLRAFWPEKPITIGEFGFSTGLKLSEDTYLDPYTASVAEMIVFLYAFSNDYSGAYLWMLSEWPIANIKYNAPWISPDRYTYESRFGLYQYDGTPAGKPKPIAHATRFFRKYIDTHESGDGTLTMTQAETPIKTGYVFEDKDALFVGNATYTSKRLKFQSQFPVNVMLCWDTQELKAMASADIEVTVNLHEFGFSNGSDIRIEGRYDKLIKTGSTVKLKLLEGQTVTFFQ